MVKSNTRKTIWKCFVVDKTARSVFFALVNANILRNSRFNIKNSIYFYLNMEFAVSFFFYLIQPKVKNVDTNRCYFHLQFSASSKNKSFFPIQHHINIVYFRKNKLSKSINIFMLIWNVITCQFSCTLSSIGIGILVAAAASSYSF